MTTQGMNPETVFADLQPVLYAASVPIDGGYAEMSKISATLAEAHGGITGRRVLDIGCGYGLTSLAIAAFGPRHIAAVDSSPAMIQLLERLFVLSDDLDVWLRRQGAPEILGEYFAPTLNHFRDMYLTFQNGLFQRRRGPFTPWVGDGLRLAEYRDRFGRIDVVVGNNYLHWPINQRIAALKSEKPDLTSDSAFVEACRDALRPLASILPSGGIAVMMEPNDFVVVDDDPKSEADLDANCLANHPLYIRFHEAFNALLKREYGIVRSVPKRSPLFRVSELPVLMSVGGFRLRRVHHVEWTYPRVLDSIFVRLPLVLGGLKLPFEEKMKLGERIRKEFREVLAAEPAPPPIRSQWFFFVLERQ